MDPFFQKKEKEDPTGFNFIQTFNLRLQSSHQTASHLLSTITPPLVSLRKTGVQPGRQVKEGQQDRTFTGGKVHLI